MNYLKIENPENVYYLDVEADSLNPTRIHCVVIKRKSDGKYWYFINKDRTLNNRDQQDVYNAIKCFILERPEATWVGHNIITFDGPVLARLCNLVWPYDRTCDTLILSNLYNPKLDGGHKLEAYGQRLKFPKLEFNDWSRFSYHQLFYCKRDIDLTEKVHEGLLTRMNKIGFSELSIDIEHKIRHIIDVQEQNGFHFNTHRAESFFQDLCQRRAHLSEEILKLFPRKLEKVGVYPRRFKKDGSHTQAFVKHSQSADRIEELEDGSYVVYKYNEFNIGSPQQRLERLLGLGFKPTSKTKKGNPKVDEDALVAFAKESGIPEVKAIADWLVLSGTIRMIKGDPFKKPPTKGWLDYVNPKDGRIHGKVHTIGNTRRMRHYEPNGANIPSSAKSPYGHECRALWDVPEQSGKKLVGYDAAGLETIGLLHYLDNKEAAEILSKPKPNDVHTMNSRALTEALGRPIDREWGAKTSWYAWLYGAYPPKLGSIVKGPPSDGQIVIDTFFKNVPGLKRLITSIQKEWQRNDGILECIDGGFVRCEKLSAALNYKVQSLGAIVMKLTSILLDEKLKELGIDFLKVGDIHDEGQIECWEKDAELVGKTAVACITQAGIILKVKQPLTGDYKIGNNWSETH